MSFVGDLIGDITGANKQADAASQASGLQYQASMAGVDENRRQYDKMVESYEKALEELREIKEKMKELEAKKAD